MLKTLAFGAVAVVASATHPINEDIVNDIKSKTDRWTPFEVQENPLQYHSHDELKRFRLGTIVRGPQGYPNPPVANGLPTDFDSRTQWGNKVHPVRDQQQCGSCWAFGASEALSDRFAIASNGATDVVLSPQDLVSCDSDNYGCQGGYLANAWNYLASTGIVSDQCLPYVSGNGQVPQCSNGQCSAGGDNRKYKCKAGSVVEMNTPDQIRSEVQTNGPVETQFTVYQDFFSYKTGVYRHVSGGVEGGHAIKLVGWGNDGNDDYWICANSWGNAWGEQGFFRIKVGECGIDSSAFACTPDLGSGKPTFF